MRNLSFKEFSCDKRYVIAAIITLVCSIICGIVLFKLSNINVYFVNFANDYIFFVFNFNNAKLIIPHLLSELFYLYLFFAIAYFTKFKFLTLIILFCRGIYFSVYVAILFSLNSLGGVTVAIIVFIPASVLSVIFCCLITDSCTIINKKYVFFVPAICALINTLTLLVLVNLLFRVIIVIV